MSSTTLLPGAVDLRLDHVVSSSRSLTLVVETSRPAAACPACGQSSRRRHSRYTRMLADLPWQGIAVTIRLQTRKFFCETPSCPRRVFTERLPETVAPYARRTLRLNEALRLIGLLVGGEPGARLSTELGLRASGDTLLRRIREQAVENQPTPRVLGVDDWAWKRRHRYGTILVDLERRRVIDLLADREAATLERWLQDHPGVEIISRDRSNAYADGAAKGAPNALQVADRWHLLKNLTEALERALASKHAQLGQAHQAATKPIEEEPAARAASEGPHATRRAEQHRQATRARRLARYDEVVALHKQGFSISAISRQTGRERKTIRRDLRAGAYREWATPKRASQLDPHRPYLEQRWAEGCHNAAQLWRELRERGFRGQAGVVRQWAGQQRRRLPAAQQHGAIKCLAKAEPPPTPRRTAWLLLADAVEPEDEAYLSEVRQRLPELADTVESARAFSRLVRKRDAEGWSAWREQASRTLLKSFAEHLDKDEAAVRAALSQSWSNGQTEGQVHRLKLIKRQMYGRGKFDLLRQRVLFRAA